MACRGIVLKGDKLLLTYAAKIDQYGIPGGGLEGEEGLAECCAREIAEETGVVVSVMEEYLTVHEFYEEFLYETHFFVCRVIGETEPKLTRGEQKVGMVSKWVDIKEALAIFSKHGEYAATDEEKRGIYLREYMALNAWTAENSQE